MRHADEFKLMPVVVFNWIQFCHQPTVVYEERRSAWPVVRKQCQHHSKDKNKDERDKKQGGTKEQSQSHEVTAARQGQVKQKVKWLRKEKLTTLSGNHITTCITFKL